MFTGIITDIGRIRAIEQRGDTRLTVETAYDTGSIDLGASVSHSGACLTVVDKGPGWFAVEASAETLARTTLGDWQEGTRINLERAMKVGDELGGHIVSGHVDGIGRVLERYEDARSWRFRFEAPEGLARYIARKGSVCIDGVSLTVNEVEGARFGVNIIPHTLSHTTLGARAVGDRVNLEVDLVARYLERLLEGRTDAV